jgi:hypothetical protein
VATRNALTIKSALRLADYRFPIGEYGRLVMWADTSGHIRARIDEESRRDQAYVVRLPFKLDNTEGNLSARGAVRALMEAVAEIQQTIADDVAGGDSIAQAISTIDRERQESARRNKRTLPAWQRPAR